MNEGLVAVLLKNQGALRRFFRARGAGEAADDLLHDLWLKAQARAGAPVSDPLAYLYRMAANLLLDRRRAELRRIGHREEWTATEERSDVSAEQEMIARDELRMVEARLAELGERTETIFRRFRLEGASQRDLARELGISVSAVEKHLQKAYRALLELRKGLNAD